MKWYHKFALITFCTVGMLVLMAQNYNNTNGASLPLGTTGQVPVVNAAGTGYGPVTFSGDGTLTSTGALSITGLHFGATDQQNCATAPTSGQLLSYNGTCIAGITAVNTLPSGTQGLLLGNNNGTTGYQTSIGPFYAGLFPAATDPCNAINLAFIASGNGQVNVDAQGPAMVTLAATPCTFLTANFLVNSAPNGGKVLLPGVNMWVPLVPSNYGCITATATCVNGPNPPPGVIVIPNKTRGIEGLGRDNSGIYVCAATQTGKTCTGANAPVIRQWAISTTSITPVALLAYNGGSATGHRNYITINTTGDIFGTGGNVTNPGTCTASNAVANGTHFYITFTCTTNLSGVLSGGQVITTTNFLPAAYSASFTVGYGNTPGGASSALPFPLTNGSGQTVFVVDAGTSNPSTCTTCTGNVTVGFNLIPGEHVLVAGSSVINNNFAWRVCATSVASGGSQQDPNCPVNPSATQVAVVGTSSDQKFNNAGAQTSTLCSSSCGTLFGEIPVIDYGSNPTNFQFNMMVKGLTISCNAVPSCVNARSMTGNEQSGMEFTLMNGSPMWCMDFWTSIAEDAQSWHDLECIAGPTLVGASALSHITAGSTGFIINESAMRAMRGATVNYNSANLTPASIVGTVPNCGVLMENSTSTWLSDFHSEGFQFNVCYGVGSPSVLYQGYNLGGQAGGSCGNRIGSTSTVGCGAMDGPFTYKTTLNGALASTGLTSIPVTAATAAQCQFNATLPTGGAGFGVGMLVSIGGIGAADLETVQITAATSANTLTTTATSNTHLTNEPVFCSWSASQMVSGNFPTAIQGGQSGPWSSDFSFTGVKRNTGAVLSLIDDYSGCMTNDSSVMHYTVDTSTSGGPIQRSTTSGVCPNLMAQLGTGQNGSAAGTVANPSVVTFPTGFVGSPAGAFSCDPTASTHTCVVNTTAVTANSRVQITPVAASPGLTCNATADTPTSPRLASVSAGVSFTINLGSFTTTPECFNFTIIN